MSSALLLPLLKSHSFTYHTSFSLSPLLYISLLCSLFSTSSIPGDRSLPARSNSVHGKQLKRHMVFLSKDFHSEALQKRAVTAVGLPVAPHTHSMPNTHHTREPLDQRQQGKEIQGGSYFFFGCQDLRMSDMPPNRTRLYLSSCSLIHRKC